MLTSWGPTKDQKAQCNKSRSTDVFKRLPECSFDQARLGCVVRQTYLYTVRIPFYEVFKQLLGTVKVA